MSIESRGKNKWRFRKRKDGIIYTQNFYGSEKEAKKAHKLFEVDILKGNVGYNENMKFADLADLCFKEYFLKECKVSTYRNVLSCYKNHLMPTFGCMKLNTIKTIHIQQFINELNTKLKPNTVNGIIGSLERFFSLAVGWDILKDNPCKNIRKPKKVKRGGQELLTMEQITKLFKIYENDNNLLHKSAFYLAICCGLRNSEIRALTLDDIDFNNSIITVNKQIGEVFEGNKISENITTVKTLSSNRTIHVPNFAMNTLKLYINSLHYTPMTKQIYWSHITRKPITKHCLSKRFTRILQNNNLPAIRFHDLRHLQATLLISANINPQAVAKRLGHSNMRTTMDTYIHSIQEVDKKISDTFENYIKEQIKAK